MTKDQIQKITNFCNSYPNHDSVKFYKKYLSLNLDNFTESDFESILKDSRNSKLLNQLSTIIDDIFRNTIQPLEVEDLFLSLIDSNFEFNSTFDFCGENYIIVLTKKSENPLLDNKTIADQIYKTSEILKEKKLFLSLIGSSAESSGRINYELELSKSSVTPVKSSKKDCDYDHDSQRAMLEFM